MSNSNRVTEPVPAPVIADVLAKLKEVRTLLQPYVQALTPDERRALPKMSDKTVAFVEKVNLYTTSNPEFAPAFMHADELHSDLAMVVGLRPILDICDQLCSNVDDTNMLAGSEAYVQALMYYNSVKLAARTGQPSAKPIYDDLSMRFPGATRKAPLAPVG
jgi:hypothetical protein